MAPKSPAAAEAPRELTRRDDPLADRARELAQRHHVSKRRSTGSLTARVAELKNGIDRVARHWSHASIQASDLAYAAEWLLDNLYVVRRALREVREDMPAGYYRSLPRLTRPELGEEPRIYAVATELLRGCRGRFSGDDAEHFLHAYQETRPLTMGELWALPTMLRFTALEVLAEAVSRLSGLPFAGRPLAGSEGKSSSFGWTEELSSVDRVSTAIASLRALDAIDWSAFFEAVSHVERVLRGDLTYASMDFDTRDRYRREVESLASTSRREEVPVAEAALEFASRMPSNRGDPAQGHVGCALLGEGRRELERELGCLLPLGLRLRRLLLAHPTFVYLGGIGSLAAGLWLLAVAYGVSRGGGAGQVAAVAVLTAVPALTIAVALVNWLLTLSLFPRVLPKLDFREGIPGDCRAMIVVPALFRDGHDVDSLLEQLELHHLSNPDPLLGFAVLADFADAPRAHMVGDGPIVERAKTALEALNRRYGRDGPGPFYVFLRERRWNPSEGVWMGWERKRGKLEEFNRLLLGGGPTSFTVQAGDLSVLPEFRYVLTADADTGLPRGSAARLVGTLAHPLNRPHVDPRSRRVVAGYTILQPRVEITAVSANQSPFSRIFSGDTGLDLYSRAVSDVYQDLFGEGLYVGKGLYDLDGFHRTLEGVVPENSLLSHDLLEGVHGRVALVTDVTLLEDYPGAYLPWASRQHRWIRGDWQLLPWLFLGRSRQGAGRSLPAIHRWKIADNLRRSLLAPALLAWLAAAWLWLPGSALLWTLLAALTPEVPLLTSAGQEVAARARRGAWAGPVPALRRHALRWLLQLAFLPYEAFLTLDAIVRTLFRLGVTRRNLLEWTTAAHTSRLFQDGGGHLRTWTRMAAAPLSAGLLAWAVAAVNPTALLAAAPFLLAWMLAPHLAWRISKPEVVTAKLATPEQRYRLSWLARRTWFFFERFVGPDDHWLPPDHFQESPKGVVAHRTSPTNVGLGLLSTLSAHDFGYIGKLLLAFRVSQAFESLDRLERYRGHFLNWYDTRTLKPLHPRYVSTVDSGNLAASLVALREGCLEVLEAPVLRWEEWQGLLDTLSVLAEELERMKEPAHTVFSPVRAHLDEVRRQILAVRHDRLRWPPLWETLAERQGPELARLLGVLLDQGTVGMSAGELDGLRDWSERIRRQLHNTLRELRTLTPWRFSLAHVPELLRSGPESGLQRAWRALRGRLEATESLVALAGAYETHREGLRDLVLRTRRAPSSEAERERAAGWLEDLLGSLRRTENVARELVKRYTDIMARAERTVAAMDFRFLFDSRRKLFTIGYNVDAEQHDTNHYDLLSSEARVASLLAIAKGDAPQAHWLHLGRPVTQLNGSRALLSWSGTLFEYLMPLLLLEEHPGTLLAESDRAAMKWQVAYGQQKGVPWGVSESGYYRFDTQQNYQYRAFGVPGLGLKRGLEEDLVVAPYACLLALPLDPQEVMDNVERLIEEGLLGGYGLYEAVDYTPSRLTLGQKKALVRSYMAHHQGMILVSLGNYLHKGPMVRRFHRDPSIRSVEMLLQERIHHTAPLERPHPSVSEGSLKERRAARHEPWSAPLDAPFPLVHFLSNGTYGVLITSGGGGYSRWGDVDLTRWRADTTGDDWGTWIYLRDVDADALWSVGCQPTGTGLPGRTVTFSAHKADLRCELHQISASTEIAVHPEDPVEVRRVVLTNKSSRPRLLQVTSYAEVVLAPQDTRHPAFNKLFIESRFLEDANVLLFSRRPRDPGERPVHLAHLLVLKEGAATGERETDRARFLGRDGTVRSPAALRSGGAGLTGTTGATLDPVFSLSQQIILEPHATVELAFVTLASESREQALTLAERYRQWNQIHRVFGEARTHSEIELERTGLTTAELERFQVLLSLLLYPHEALRAKPHVIAANRLGQPGLWPFAISGDHPILLVRVGAEDEAGVVLDVLKAHAYWRSRGLRVDLAILNEKQAGYSQEVQGHLQRLVAQTGGDAWLDRHGGIFLLRAEFMQPEEIVLLETAARVVVNGVQGDLASQLRGIVRDPPPLPALSPSPTHREPPREIPPISRPQDLVFDNGWGGFSPDGREYAIFREPGSPPPAPWINVVANPHFGFLVTDSGSSCTWCENSGENRLTPWHNDPVSDPTGEALYLRDEETGAVWTPTPMPAGAAAPYLVRHGVGYSTFEHSSHGLKQQVRVFAAQSDPVKFVQVRLENAWSHTRRITATHYVEWVLGTHRSETQPFVVLEHDEARNAILARNPYHSEFGARVAFSAADRRLHGLTGSRSEFLGRMGNPESPAGLGRIGLAGAVRAGLDPCAALQIHLDIPAGTSVEFVFLLGQGGDREHALRLIEKYRGVPAAEAALAQVRSAWERRLETVQVRTPDPALDLLLNRWLPYQNLSCRLWGRSALYQSSGAFGFRDQLQDVLAVLHAEPGLAREHLLRAAAHQFEGGDVLHWWHPPTGRGVRTRISDDLLWLPFVTAEYVAVTGDDSILDEKIPFLQGPELEPGEHERYGWFPPTDEAFPLLEHGRRALERASTKGPHELPLFGGGDWNDGMNRVGAAGEGESVWLGWFLFAALESFAPLCERRGEAPAAEGFRRQARALRERIEAEGWDGGWYLRGFYDDGAPLGSARNEECRIDAVAQSWAVLSEAGDPVRAGEAMDAVAERLVRPEDGLVLLLTPPFDTTSRDPGYIKGYPPGIRENGGQYTHAALWTVWAFARLGQGSRAGELLRLLNPIYHADTPGKAALYKVEPYVVAADVYGIDPHVGRGGWTWYTGSAGWMYRLGVEALLGLRRRGDRLFLEPCIPADWRSFEITYREGDTTYRFEVQNPSGVEQGVAELLLDGEPRLDRSIPLLQDGREHGVVVRMG
ncbi:MAG: GH36-type glycosyl hydrolase domain-containing protein [Deferrisomatales bacterium]